MEQINYNAEPQKKLSLLGVSNDTVFTNEVSEEFDLPDYIPEVRRVISVKASVLPESRYINDKGIGSELEYGGTVTYLVIYTDDEDELCSTSLSSEYQCTSQLSVRPETVLIDTVVDTSSIRVNAPRKITLKSRLKSRILGFNSFDVDEKITPKSISDEMYLQRSSRQINAMEINQVGLENLKISDKLDMQSTKIIKPIWCDAILTVSQAKAQANFVSVKGDVTVKCICLTQDGCVTLEKSMVINEEIENDSVRADDFASVNGRCISLSISNEQNGEDNQLFFDLTYELEGVVSRNRSEQITTDCYSTKYETESSYRTLDCYRVVKSQNSSFTVSESLKRKDSKIKEIIDILATSVCEKTEIKGQKASVYGKALITVIGTCEAKENGKMEYACEEYELPFKYDTDFTGADLTVRNNFALGKVNARQDAERIFVSCEVYLAQDVIEKTKCQALDTAVINKDKEYKCDDFCVRAYFPKDNDTLWEIAKKYHTTVNNVMEQNDIDVAYGKLPENLIL